MFKGKKKKRNTDFEFNLKLIEKINTLEAQNKFLFEKIQNIEIELKNILMEDIINGIGSRH